MSDLTTQCPHCHTMVRAPETHLHLETSQCGTCAGYFHTLECPTCGRRTVGYGHRREHVVDCCGYTLRYLFCANCNSWKYYWADGAIDVVYRCCCGTDVRVDGAGRIVNPFVRQGWISEPSWWTDVAGWMLIVGLMIYVGIPWEVILYGVCLLWLVIGAKSLLKPTPLLTERQARDLVIGTVLDVRNHEGKWYGARVKGVDPDSLLISFIGWGDRYDEKIVIGAHRFAPAGTFTRS